jgi:two-component system, LytTR family, response regulator
VTATIRAIVVDDEAPARQRLQSLLEAHPDIDVVRECANGREAVDVLTTTSVDLVFLDVQMPELDGFGVIAAVGVERMPPIIFTSAYSEFAVRAFEAYALDYLLKPFDDKRLEAALDRAREEVSARRATSMAENDARLVGLLQHLDRAESNHYPEAIAIKTGAQYVVTRVADIDWIEADGNYAKVYIQKRPRLLTKSLTTLEKDVLDPETFIRVHRSAIVNTARIAAVEPQLHGDVTLLLHDGTHVQCSRRFRKRLEEKLYFTT